MTMTRGRYKSILTIMICFLWLSAGCSKKAAQEMKPERVPVKAVRIDLRGLTRTIDYVGNVKAEDEAVVYPKVGGKVIEKVKEEGSEVRKGDAIVYIDRDEVGLKFEKAPVESPLAGTIGRVLVDIGQHVSASTPVALVVDMRRVKINLDVPEKYLPQVSVGQEALIVVDAYPAEEFKGIVTKISPVVDLNTRTAPVEILLDNPLGRLKSGMFARVKLVIAARQDVPVILKEAVIGQEPDTYVYVVNSNNTASLRKVTLGMRQGPYYEVREGLKEGEQVVIMGQQRLREGTPVIAEEEKE